jgi:nucleoside-diphosphate-sugar epimerase
MKKIFITGSTGFLGSSVVKLLITTGYEIHCLTRKSSNLFRLNDVLNKINLVELNDINFIDYFKDHQIDCVLHCATNYGRFEKNPINTIEANLLLPLKILYAASISNVKSFINTDTILDKRINHYSLSKKQFLSWLKTYSNNLICVNVALEHFYGPGDDPSKFVTMMLNEMLNNAEKIDLTAGEQKRDFIYIDDVVNAFILILKFISSQKNGFYEYEVGSGSSVKIKSLVKLIKELSKCKVTKLNFGAINYRGNEVMASAVNISNLLKLGWKPQDTLESGLLKTIEFEKYLRR